MMHAGGSFLGLLGLSLVLAFPALDEVAAVGSTKGGGFRISDLEEGVRVWRSAGKPPSGFPIELAGFNFLWQASPGDGSQLVVISRVHGGYLILFDEQGNLLDLIETGEIYYSILLCDLDQDAVAEVITDEKQGFGTGYLNREFHIYKRVGDALVELGTRTSYRSWFVYEPNAPPRREVLHGHIRCDPGDGMQPRGIAYIIEQTAEGRNPRVIGRSQLRAEGGKLTELPE